MREDVVIEPPISRYESSLDKYFARDIIAIKNCGVINPKVQTSKQCDVEGLRGEDVGESCSHPYGLDQLQQTVLETKQRSFRVSAHVPPAYPA